MSIIFSEEKKSSKYVNKEEKPDSKSSNNTKKTQINSKSYTQKEIDNMKIIANDPGTKYPLTGVSNVKNSDGKIEMVQIST